MAIVDSERTRALARDLVEFLSSYEEDLILLERTSPAVGQLRRAVGIAIAEACYLIADEANGGDWASPSDNSQARPQ